MFLAVQTHSLRISALVPHYHQIPETSPSRLALLETISDIRPEMATHNNPSDLHRKIEALETELLKKTSECNSLHGTVIELIPPQDQNWDQVIIPRFARLNAEIIRFSHRHFRGLEINPEQYVGSNLFTEMSDCDQILFWQSVVADRLDEDVIGAGVFGLDGDVEDGLREVERRLGEEKVPQTGITSWYSETIKITKSLAMSAEARLKTIQDLSARTYQGLASYTIFHNPDAAISELADLYERAFETALLARESGICYQWLQREHLKQIGIVVDDFDVLPNYCENDGDGQIVHRRILFGSLYKLVGQGFELVARGDFLTPDDESVEDSDEYSEWIDYEAVIL